MSYPIVHSAVVDSLLPGGAALARIDDVAAADCSGCRIASLCRRDERVAVTVHVPAGLALSPGQRIEIQAPGTVTRRAVALLLLLPLAVLILAVVLTVLAGGSEGASVAVGLVALCCTFALLYTLRSRLEQDTIWKVVRLLQ